jgi:hypothetical protein
LIAALIILAVSTSAGWAGAFWAIKKWRDANADADKHRLIAAQEQANAANARAEMRLIEQARQRGQDVLHIAQKEISTLLGELDQCSDPAVVRARLERVFKAPERRSADRVAAPAAGTVAMRGSAAANP